MCKLQEIFGNNQVILRKQISLMENINLDNVNHKQCDKKFYIITLAVFLPLAAILKVYFFLR